MRRRNLIQGIAGSAIAWPFAARAQQRIPVIGILGGTSLEAFAERLRAFRQGLKDTGHVEGQNVAIEYRFAEGQFDRLPGLAADLVRQQVNVILAATNVSTSAAKAATATIPVVFIAAGDPVRLGFVSSLNRPGGNMTGVTNFANVLSAKNLELLNQVVPGAVPIGYLINPDNPNAESDLISVQDAARALGRQLIVIRGRQADDVDQAFVVLSAQKAGALLVGADPLFIQLRDKLILLAAQHSLPASYPLLEFARAGGLMSYASSNTDAYQLAGIYVGRILKGEKPADLPVQQAVKAELSINLKTANALGLTIPLPLLGRADEVIE
jgi:putative ABC transport system substrate-binding protein